MIVGEVRSAECLDLLLALNSGPPGMATIHASSAREALVKLCTLPLLAGENVSCLPGFRCLRIAERAEGDRKMACQLCDGRSGQLSRSNLRTVRTRGVPFEPSVGGGTGGDAGCVIVKGDGRLTGWLVQRSQVHSVRLIALRRRPYTGVAFALLH